MKEYNGKKADLKKNYITASLSFEKRKNLNIKNGRQCGFILIPKWNDAAIEIFTRFLLISIFTMWFDTIIVDLLVLAMACYVLGHVFEEEWNRSKERLKKS